MATVYVVHMVNGKEVKTPVGHAEAREDGGLEVRLSALPLGGVLAVNLDKAREEARAACDGLVFQGTDGVKRDVTGAALEAVAEDTERLELERMGPGTTGKVLPPFPGPRKGGAKGKVVQLRGYQDPDMDRGSEFNADITPKVSVRIFGVYGNHVKGPQTFDKTFKVGDLVEYRSYNLKYTGIITAIGPQTITVHDKDLRQTRRMKLRDFTWRNWNFDAEKVAKHNAFESMHI